MSSIFFGKEISRRCYLKLHGKKYRHGNVFTCTKSSVCCCRSTRTISKMIWEKTDYQNHVETYVEKKWLWSLFWDQIWLGCTQREEKVNEQAVQSKTERFRSFMTTGGTDRKYLANEGNPSWMIAAWSHGMTGQAEKCVERNCEFAKNDVTFLQSMATPCVDDHLIPPEDFEVQKELTLCLCLPEIGRPDLIRSVDTLARPSQSETKGVAKDFLRWINLMNQSKDDRQFCHAGNEFEDCKHGMFQNVSFTSDLQNSKSRSGGILCIFGSRTFVPIS